MTRRSHHPRRPARLVATLAAVLVAVSPPGPGAGPAFADAAPAVGAPTRGAQASVVPALAHRGQRAKLPSSARPRCSAVAHVGDSTTVQSRGEQIAAYAHHFDVVIVDGGGGRAILQTIPSDSYDGVGAVEAIRATGYRGCWVVSLGTNDAANIAAGANYSQARAIDAMLAAIDPNGTTPVAWVEVYTTRGSGYWRQANMAAWNEALRAASARWPNLEILPWAATLAAHPDWLSDGIHHNATGRVERANWIAATADRALNG